MSKQSPITSPPSGSRMAAALPSCARRSAALTAVFLSAVALVPVMAHAQSSPAGADQAAQVALPAPAMPATRSVDPSLLDGLEYRYVGPTRGGRVTAVAGHAAQPNTFFFGGTGGGVFRSTDAGASWENITDGQIPVGSIGAIEVAPSNPEIVYVATGSAAIRSNVSIGKGVYRSDDGGETWRAIGLEKTGVVGDMVVHPSDPDIAYVAAVGNPFGRNAERGVFRTRDGGSTWEKVLFVSDSTGVVDIDMNPLDPNVLYAGAWRAERKPWTIISGAREGGVYRSTDGGDSWTKLGNGLPDEYIGKISISIAKSDPRRVFALIEAGDGTLGVAGGVHGGLYRSDDAGDTWTRTSNQAGLLNRPFYYTYVDVDPTNADVVYVNNETFWKSTDGGATFRRLSTPHTDNHGMWINPTDSDVFIQSNDGGVNVTQDGGRTWSSQNNQPTAEVYQVDLDDRFPYWIYAGQQDNTTIGVPSTGEAARAENEAAWRTDIGGCETGPAVPQPGSNGRIFFSNCKGRFYRYSEITGQATEYSVGASNMYGHNPRDLKYRFQRVVPIVVSPHDPNIVYHASQFLHRTNDGGRTWETISPDLTANDPRGHVISGTPITRDVTGEEFYSTLYTVAESRLERGVIWTGSNDGPVHVTRDNGASWTNVTPPDLPGGGRVQTVEASPHRPGSAYIAVLRYMFDDWTPHIYRTDDYGSTWMKLTGPTSGFPQDHPTRVVREDPDREGLLYAGTEFGMFISFDNGGSWQPFQQNLPATVISDMKVYRQDLIIATQGRGFWIADNLTPLHQLTDRIAAQRAHLFSPATAYRGSREPAQIDYHLSEPVQGIITLDILDESGTVVRTFASDTSTAAPTTAPRPGMPGAQAGRFGGPGPAARSLPVAAGLNRFEWDMRAASASSTGRGAGPMVPPGQYRARLTVPGAETQVRPLVVEMDPRLLADGITADDLRAQYALASLVAQLTADVQTLQTDLRAARERNTGNAGTLERLDALERQVVTQPSQAYPQPMLAAQVSYLNGIVSRGDNRPHRDAYTRYEELRAQTDAVRAELQQIR